MISRLILCSALALCATTNAFAPQANTSRKTLTTLSMSNEGPRVHEGGHEELMYALGVNLARQLGDVRPCKKKKKEYVMLMCVETVNLFYL